MDILTLIIYFYILPFVSKGFITNELGEIITYYSPKISSKSVHEYIDLTVDPCDNFYKFSCGNWIKAKKIKSDNETSYYHSDSNFNNFVTEALDGKYNDESIAIKNIYHLIRKCKEIPESKVEVCYQEILEFGMYAFSSLFIVKNRVESEIINDDHLIVEDMIGKIIEEIRLLIEEKSDIFDKESRDNFLHKLNEMELVRNLDPFELSNIPLMEDCYKNIGVQYDDNIESVLETIKTYMSKLKDSSTLDSCSIKIFQYGKYLRTYVQSNVMYHPTSNKLIVNSDALKEPSFSRYFPNSLNYGYIGFTIAREILRALDSDNRNKSNVTQFSIEHFKEKSDCFIKRYRLQKENITAKYINDQTTLAKDIVDNGGLKIVHRTYMKYLQSIGGEELNVPDFEDFTSEQLFFFSFGRNFCAHKTKNYTENQINTDEYILSEMRTNEALSNYEPFSNAFKCKLKREMNPEHKCEL